MRPGTAITLLSRDDAERAIFIEQGLLFVFDTSTRLYISHLPHPDTGTHLGSLLDQVVRVPA